MLKLLRNATCWTVRCSVCCRDFTNPALGRKASLCTSPGLSKKAVDCSKVFLQGNDAFHTTPLGRWRHQSFKRGALTVAAVDSLSKVERPRRRAAPDRPERGERKGPIQELPFEERRSGLAEGTSFKSLGLAPVLVKRLEQLGLKVPTEVQAAACPVLLEGKDATVQSYTGSGKTLAYLLPILSRIGPYNFSGNVPRSSVRGVEAVIVAPSRELAMQIVRTLEQLLGDEYRSLVQQLIGGANMARQEDGLKRNKPLIVVGTPGRISELSRAGRLQTHGTRMLVLDEADELLSLQFRADMLRILEHVGSKRTRDDIVPDMQAMDNSGPGRGLPAENSLKPGRVERQTVLVSATMSTPVLQAAARWGYKPLHVTPSGTQEILVGAAAKAAGLAAKPGQTGAAEEGDGESQASLEGLAASLPPNINHMYVLSAQRHRVDTLRRCIHASEASAVLVFMNYGQRLKDTQFKLEAKGMRVSCLHGGLTKVQRGNVLSAFRDGKLRVLLVSEVAARGIDVVDCDLVVNLELPSDAAHYAHRAGRTGRIGRQGTVISICEKAEEFVVQKFARQLKISVPQMEVREGSIQLRDSSVSAVEDAPV